MIFFPSCILIFVRKKRKMWLRRNNSCNDLSPFTLNISGDIAEPAYQGRDRFLRGQKRIVSLSYRGGSDRNNLVTFVCGFCSLRHLRLDLIIRVMGAQLAKYAHPVADINLTRTYIIQIRSSSFRGTIFVIRIFSP